MSRAGGMTSLSAASRRASRSGSVPHRMRPGRRRAPRARAPARAEMRSDVWVPWGKPTHTGRTCPSSVWFAAVVSEPMASTNESIGAVVGRMWPGSEIRFEPIAAGLTNQNFRVDVDGHAHFVRLPGPSTELLAVDRANELHNTRAAATAGVGPRVLNHDPSSGAL